MAEASSVPNEPRPTFIFKGTIRKLKAASMRGVPVDERTAVVRVDQVLEAPRNLAHCAGKDITVRLAGRTKASVGQQLMFHTAGWMFGENVAVRAVRQETVTRAHAAALAQGGNPVEHKATRDLQERVTDADLVVSGKVIAVSLPATAAPGVAIAPSPVGTSRRPVSEHDPKWREAVIAVDRVHKGTRGGNHVTVRFPASTDVGWFKAPKFEAGQQGYFMLRKGMPAPATPEESPPRALDKGTGVVAEEPPGVYTALHPLDFQPYSQKVRVRTAISAACGNADGCEDH